MKEITIAVPDGTRAEWDKDGFLRLVKNENKPKDNRPVTERIKTFEDACEELNRRAENGDETAGNLLADYESNKDNITTKQTVAFMKLAIITAALNEGWEPKFTKGEYRWFPWFELFTKEELDEMDEQQSSRVARRSRYNALAYGGVACVDAFSDSSYTYTLHGSRLAFREKAIAEYAGKQFIETWADFVFKPKEEEAE